MVLVTLFSDDKNNGFKSIFCDDFFLMGKNIVHSTAVKTPTMTNDGDTRTHNTSSQNHFSKTSNEVAGNSQHLKYVKERCRFHFAWLFISEIGATFAHSEPTISTYQQCLKAVWNCFVEIQRPFFVGMKQWTKLGSTTTF